MILWNREIYRRVLHTAVYCLWNEQEPRTEHNLYFPQEPLMRDTVVSSVAAVAKIHCYI
jgi:hypothetical protein